MSHSTLYLLGKLFSARKDTRHDKKLLNHIVSHVFILIHRDPCKDTFRSYECLQTRMKFKISSSICSEDLCFWHNTVEAVGNADMSVIFWQIMTLYNSQIMHYHYQLLLHMTSKKLLCFSFWRDNSCKTNVYVFHILFCSYLKSVIDGTHK